MTGFSDNALLELLTRFALTLLFNIVQMRIVSKHAPESRKNVYSFFIISVVVFFLANALGSFNMQIGMAIGMFAVFGIVRYRTEALRPQEMTYLFAAIGIAVINALSSGTEGWLELVVVNTLVLAFIYLLERFLLTEEKEEPALQKVNVTLPVSELDQAVFDARIATLATQMQVQVVRVHISKVDYALGTAQIQVYYEK
jgi:Ca2+/Na+ antiporter